MRATDQYRSTNFYALDTAVASEARAEAPAKANLAFHLTGFSVSFNGTPATAVQFTIFNGATAIDITEMAAVYIAPLIINGIAWRPWEFTKGQITALSVPSLGAGIRCTARICGFYSTPSND